MRILALDSTTPFASVALLSGDDVVAEARATSSSGHSTNLLPMAELVLKTQGLTGADLQALDAVAVTVGPGSFTGLRVGLATATTLALAAGIPCFGVSALEAAAFGARDAGSPVVALMDAFRGEVFAAVYDSEGRLVEEPHIVALRALLESLQPRPTAFVGEGAAKWRDEIRAAFPLAVLSRSRGLDVYLAASVARRAAERMQAGERPDPGGLRPFYLRDVDVRVHKV